MTGSDTAAGVIIAREAGARVNDLDGTDHTADAAATIAAVPGIASDLLALINRADEHVSA